MSAVTDVFIAGAGPVGLMLAAELRRNGVSVRIVDAHAERTFFVKALGVTARTLEVFEDLDVAREAIDAGVWIEGMDTYQNGALTFSMDVPGEGLPYGALSLAQFDTERILEATLARHGGRVEYGTSLTGFTETADALTVHLSDGSEARCRWLVGCDGARSFVRQHLGVPFEGDRYPQTFMLADLDVDWHLPRGRMIRFNLSSDDGSATTTLAAIPVRGSARRYRLSMVLPPDDAARLADTPAPDFAEIERIMLPILPQGVRLSSMRWSSVYRVSHRIAAQYARGRVFLAGDAAHIHPPVGGRGMNTGLQDAHNLAWKLTLAARGLAGDGLLASYEAERRPVGLDVVEATSRALNTVLAHGEVRPAMRETQLLVGYRGSPIVKDECADMAPEWPAPGDRVPEVGGLMQSFIGHAQRLQAHIGRGRHMLIGFGRCNEFDAASEALHSLLIVDAKETTRENEAYRTLRDASGEFAKAFGARDGMVWIVRPDGHIGYRSHTCSAQAITNWLGSFSAR